LTSVFILLLCCFFAGATLCIDQTKNSAWHLASNSLLTERARDIWNLKRSWTSERCQCPVSIEGSLLLYR
jgi:hypothetical protein